MKNLPQIKTKLKQLLTKGIPEVLKGLKESLPEDAPKYGEVLLIEGRFNAENKKLLRGTQSNEELQIAYNQIRAALLDFIDGLQESDFNKNIETLPTKNNAQKGELLYRIPSKMKMLEETKCVVRIATDEDEIIKNIELDADVALRTLNRISNLMQVTLLDPQGDEHFAIRTITESEQIIFEDGYTEWTFFVKPLQEGTHSLVIKVAVIELIFNKERKREIVFEEKIAVSTNAIEEEVFATEFKKVDESFVLGNAPEPILKTRDIGSAAAGGGGNFKKQSPTILISPAPQSPTKSNKINRIRQIAGMATILIISLVGINLFNNSNLQSSEAEFGLAYAKTPNKYGTTSETILLGEAQVSMPDSPLSSVIDETPRQVVAQEASTAYAVTPATYKTETETVLVKNEEEELLCIPPIFTEKTEKVVVEEKVVGLNNVQVEYMTEQKKILVRPEVVEYICKQPTFEIVQKEIEVSPQTIKIKRLPAEYKIIIDTLVPAYRKLLYDAPILKKVKAIEISPAYSKWIYQKNENCESANIMECMELVEQKIPAVMEKIAAGQLVEGCKEGYEYRDGLCIKYDTIPPKTRTKQVLSVAAREEKIIVPPKMKTYEFKEYKKDGEFEERRIPAKYRTLTVKLIKNKQNIPAANISKSYADVKVETLQYKAAKQTKVIPAQYTTINRRMEAQPAKITERSVPPQYRTETVQTNNRQYAEPKIFPAKSKTVEKKVMEEKGGELVEVEYLKNPSSEVISQVQTKLKAQDFYQGAISGILDAPTLTALSIYQNEKSLPIGLLNRETLDQMGVNY